jgi:hypothetical protein
MRTWVQFNVEGQSDSGKTKLWSVVNIRRKLGKIEQRGRVGIVSWHGAWRRYCFFPACNTIFEENCLRDIARFCEEATRSHRRK